MSDGIRGLKTEAACRLLVIALAAVLLASTAAWTRGAESIAARFHRETALARENGSMGESIPPDKKNEQHKDRKNMKPISLPRPDYRGMPLEEALERRRSERCYADKALSLDQVSQLLFAAQGRTGGLFGKTLRTVPSAGALYPLEIYAIVNNVDGLDQGVYHYRVEDHALELVKAGNMKRTISAAGLGQDMLGTAGVTFVISAVFERTQLKYGERGMRYVYMEAGHASQNISLQAVSLGLGSVCVGAFYDNQVNDLIDVDGVSEAALYLQAVGPR